MQRSFLSTDPSALVSMDQYRMIKQVGKGSFGKVYLVVHRPSGKQVRFGPAFDRFATVRSRISDGAGHGVCGCVYALAVCPRTCQPTECYAYEAAPGQRLRYRPHSQHIQCGGIHVGRADAHKQTSGDTLLKDLCLPSLSPARAHSITRRSPRHCSLALRCMAVPLAWLYQPVPRIVSTAISSQPFAVHTRPTLEYPMYRIFWISGAVHSTWR